MGLLVVVMSVMWLNKTEFFEWTDGSPVAYTNWAPNQPNNANGGQHCVAVGGSSAEPSQW